MIQDCALAIGLSALAAALPPLEADVYVSGLTRVTNFAQHPTEPTIQYATEQNGQVRIIESGALRPEPVVDIAPLMNIGFSEHGLISLALPPDHGSTGDFYLMYTGLPNFSSQLRWFTLDAATYTADPNKNTRTIRLTQPSRIHNGNAIRFAPDGSLYISFGDGGPVGDPDAQGQNKNTLYGTISRIIPNPAGDYAVPPDNPFVGTDGADEIWHYGLRNPWKFSLDLGPCATGGMLIGDVGDNDVEELNFALPEEPGQNFGWSCFEGSAPFAGCEPPLGESFTFPIYEYDRASGLGRSISAGVVYRGADMPHHRGRAFFGDFISGKVFSVDLQIDELTGEPLATDFVDHTPDLVASLGSGLGLVVGFGTDAEGELHVIDYNGRILRITSSVAPADVNADGSVDAADLAQLIASWGDAACSTSDITNDETVGAADLAALIASWSN